MKKRSLFVWTVALVTLASGVVNLVSVTSPALPERRAILREVFPLEFLHLSRFLTLIIGFALVISAFNVYKRKKRAFQGVVLLTVLSVVFHLTKGLDYEEALLALVFLGLLAAARKRFTVKSSLPDLRSGVIRLGIAALVAFSYSVAGFWLLDKKEFGIDFTLADSIKRTLLFFSLVGDPAIVPQTRHARWFVDSLYVMTATAVGYSLYALFRPALYKFRTLPLERARVAEILSRHGRSALDYFKTWPDKSYFFSPSQKTFLAYRVAGNFALVLSDPVGPEEEIEETVHDFMELCDENDWGLAFHQTLPDLLPIYRRLGFRKLKIGDDAIIDLTGFNLDGRGMKSFRHKVNQLEKAGIQIQIHEPPVSEAALLQVREVSDEWLQLPGRRERGFTQGKFEPEYVRSTPLFAALDGEGRMLAFVNLIPSYRPGEATIDLMRHRLQVPNGLMDYLFVKLFLHQKEQGFQRFNLGMAPMSGFQEKEEAAPEERAVHYFFQRLNFLFSYVGLRQYKAKFASFWEPRYLVYRSVHSLPRLTLALGKVTELKE